MKCKVCGAPNRQLWPPGRGPDPSKVRTGNWMLLLRCSSCASLWVEVAHEPYASFRYLVLWPHTEDEWQRLHDYDDGSTLHDWHQAAICRLGPKLGGDDAKAIKRHIERSYGHEPYGNYTGGSEPDLERLLSEI